MAHQQWKWVNGIVFLHFLLNQTTTRLLDMLADRSEIWIPMWHYVTLFLQFKTEQPRINYTFENEVLEPTSNTNFSSIQASSSHLFYRL